MVSRIILVAAVFILVLQTTNSESCDQQSLASTCPLTGLTNNPTTDEEIQAACRIFKTYFACVDRETSTCSQSVKDSIQTELGDIQSTYNDKCGGMAINSLNIGVYIIIALAKFTYDRFV
ncbi:hypothetical protein SNE40_017584 [Patella caerulea]|uniref:Uncharacterized protein n=1 Tax=Patella caerulea TaxID=87958 RepID=A0AAN8JHC8_PATCE